MKNAYLVFFALSIIFLPIRIFILTDHRAVDYYLPKLAWNPQLWDIQYVDPKDGPPLDGTDAGPRRAMEFFHESKSILIPFLKEKLDRSISHRLASNSAIIVVMVFSLVGWLRESKFKKNESGA